MKIEAKLRLIQAICVAGKKNNPAKQTGYRICIVIDITHPLSQPKKKRQPLTGGGATLSSIKVEFLEDPDASEPPAVLVRSRKLEREAELPCLAFFCADSLPLLAIGLAPSERSSSSPLWFCDILSVLLSIGFVVELYYNSF